MYLSDNGVNGCYTSKLPENSYLFYGNVKWHFVSLRGIDAFYEEFRWVIIIYIFVSMSCTALTALECAVLSGCLENPQILVVYFSLPQEDITWLVWYFGNRSTLKLFLRSDCYAAYFSYYMVCWRKDWFYWWKEII